MQILSKPFQVISGNRTQVGACCIYFVLLLKPNCPSLPSYVAAVMGTSSCSPAGSKWKTSQRKQEQSWARTSCWIVLQEWVWCGSWDIAGRFLTANSVADSLHELRELI